MLVQKSLSSPGLDIDKLLYTAPPPLSYQPNSDNNNTPFLSEDLIIQSLLKDLDGCNTLLYDIVLPRLETDPNVFNGINIEEEEVRRNAAAMAKVANAILPSNGSSPFAADSGIGQDSTIAKDLLRVAVLESLGGNETASASSNKNIMDDRWDCLCLSSRHTDALKNRLMLSEKSTQCGHVQQPIVVPLVRALCAYAGGIGEALLHYGSMDARTLPAQKYRPRGDETLQVPLGRSQLYGVTWLLPPGAVLCVKYAIQAAARLVALDFILWNKDSSGARRHSWLSLLVPVVLHSAHKLRCGILEYAQIQMDRSIRTSHIPRTRQNEKMEPTERLRMKKDDAALGNFIAINCPSLGHVLSACDESAVAIMRSLVQVDGRRDAQVKVHNECKIWLNTLL